MRKPTKYLLVVGGPTASGKTSLAVALAQHFSTVILSADSRQFYREMAIGNARPSQTELTSVPHYFVADRSVANPLSAGAFADEALPLLEEQFKESAVVVLVGGSGLFVRAITQGLDEFPKIGVATRQRVDLLYEEEGLMGLQIELQAVDPDYFAIVDQQNPARLRRALEVYYESGQPYSSFRQKKNQPRPFQVIYLQPDWPRDELYTRINQRVYQMQEDGLEQEAKGLQVHQGLAALQTVGYQEWWPYFAGAQSLGRTVELIQHNTRNYAKRQLTWNRRDGYWKLVPKADLRSALAYIRLVREKGMILRTFPPSERVLLHAKETRKRVALVRADNDEVMTVVDLAVWKDWGIVRHWGNAECDHLAMAILLHEACYRTEKEEVFTFSEAEQDTPLLESQGWQRVIREQHNWPETLRKKFADTQLWSWLRSRQTF